ncbi:hypothetical protein SOVF_184850 [Spinacia oleracea]|nr:hypothetical protein SOVF_184850 [Spinacia oleracea]
MYCNLQAQNKFVYDGWLGCTFPRCRGLCEEDIFNWVLLSSSFNH